MRVWTEAVKRAILRHVAQTGSPLFTRQAFFAAEGAALNAETRTVGVTPRQTATRELQHLRDAGLLEFADRGTYRWRGDMPEPEAVVPSRGVFLLDAASTVLPEDGFVFDVRWLLEARRTVGQWIIYQDGEGYRAAARVERLHADRDLPRLFEARIQKGSYLEFGRIVPLRSDGRPIEGVLGDGEADQVRAAQAIRMLAQTDFDQIVDLGLIADDLLPRRDDAMPEDNGSRLLEERSAFEPQVDRATTLVNRKVRDRQFRKRVLEVYGAECALTGMKLINGGGRAEAEAAHIKSVEAGGPDKVNNGIALSGTVHWMFDRGLISLSDSGDILLSRAINDRNSVERLIHADRRARFPANAAYRPHPEYLHWHRTECFHD